jgi:cytoplasmic iron level regulating protein YaaA (DUF328/UPF0246 family)
VNLASNEYFSAIDKSLKKFLITDFKDYKDGKLKSLVFLPKARGMMVRYIIDTSAETIEDLKVSIMMDINLMLIYQRE